MDTAPFDEYRDRVRDEWIDYNDHMNVGYYSVVFDSATDVWLVGARGWVGRFDGESGRILLNER